MTEPARSARPAGLPLREPQAMCALYRMFGQHDTVMSVVARFPTWEALAAATPSELGYVLGPRGASLRLPALCPALPELPPGTSAVSRLDADYPAALREVDDPPAVLFVRGTLPPGPAVAIGGADHPSPQGIEIARSAALAAVAQRRPVIVQLGDGVAQAALRCAVTAGGKVVVVLPSGIDVPSRHAMLLDEVLAGGGAVITEVPPGIGLSDRFTAAAGRLVVALASAVVLAEVGRHQTSGAGLARSAVTAGRYLIVPTPQQHYVPESAVGLLVLTSARSFSDAWYGTSPRLHARVSNGLAPADAVVRTQSEIAEAIAVACRPRV
jgi:DNA processing protein